MVEISFQEQEIIEAHIEQRPEPDFIGEQGKLYRMNLGDSTVWVKKWISISPYHKQFPDALDGVNASPYWHEYIKIMYELIYEAFPEMTVSMYGSYDPRIVNSAGERCFRLFPGRPTTVTHEAIGHPEHTAKYMALLKGAYQFRQWQLQALKDAGQYEPYHWGPAIKKWKSVVHRRVYDLLGKDLHLGNIGKDNKEEGFQRVLRKMRKESPGNVMIDLIEAGIYPVHPEVNFIPGTPATHSRPPHGTFIELELYDPEKLKIFMNTKLSEDPVALKQFEKKLVYFQLLKILDDLFYDIILHHIGYQPIEASYFDSRVTTLLYRHLEKLRVLHSERGFSLEEIAAEIMHEVRPQIKRTLSSSKDAEEAAHKISNYVSLHAYGIRD